MRFVKEPTTSVDRTFGLTCARDAFSDYVDGQIKEYPNFFVLVDQNFTVKGQTSDLVEIRKSVEMKTGILFKVSPI